MKSNIYEYRGYKSFVKDSIESDPSGGRGQRKAIAEKIGCQVSHITNVLSGDGHFSAEQAEAVARYFGLNANETEFFLLLVQYDRAGTHSLKKFYENILRERQEKFGALKTRLNMPDTVRKEDEARYYSTWLHGAIHVLLSIPDFQTREALAKRLLIPLERVDESLNFLVSMGLIRKEGVRYVIARPLLHLDKTSPLISKHHTNWRLRAIESVDQDHGEDLHYSGVFTLNKKDLGQVKEILRHALQDALKVITASPEEDAAVLCLDVFSL